MASILSQAQTTYLNSFRTEQDSLINSMEQFAKKHKVPILNWLAAEFIEQFVVVKKPKKVLEIGTAIAYTTIRIAKLLDKNATIDTIEKSKDNIKIASRNITKSGYADKINLLKGEAGDIIDRLSAKYDLIFLDADKEDYLKLFTASLPLLKNGGVIIVDNLLWQGFTAASRIPVKFKNSTKHIRDFNKVFMEEKSLKSSIYAIGDGLGVGIKK